MRELVPGILVMAGYILNVLFNLSNSVEWRYQIV